MEDEGEFLAAMYRDAGNAQQAFEEEEEINEGDLNGLNMENISSTSEGKISDLESGQDVEMEDANKEMPVFVEKI